MRADLSDSNDNAIDAALAEREREDARWERATGRAKRYLKEHVTEFSERMTEQHGIVSPTVSAEVVDEEVRLLVEGVHRLFTDGDPVHAAALIKRSYQRLWDEAVDALALKAFWR